MLLTILGMGAAELSIVPTSDEEIRTLNRDFRGKDQSTDVLSFSQSEVGETAMIDFLGRGAAAGAKRPPLLLGDVVISVKTAQRQACASRMPAAARLRTLLIHGLLHLLGYDHERSPVEARRQFARERELAARLDYPARGGGSAKLRGPASPRNLRPAL